MNKVLEIERLSILYRIRERKFRAVNDVYLSLEKGEILGLVGESGSGKSTLAHAIIGLLPVNAVIESGSIIFLGKDLTKVRYKDFHKFRGYRGMTMIFQDPMTSLNPTMTVYEQLEEALIERKQRIGWGDFNPFIKIFPQNKRKIRGEFEKEVLEALNKTGIRYAKEIMRKYPHQLSGGERQRVMIAMNYLLKPSLLIADEPTTSLDVINQFKILKLLLELREELGTSILFISHDISLVLQIADKVAVMYAGSIIEEGISDEIYEKPLHPYTIGLLKSIPTKFKGDGRISQISGSPPDPMNLPNGCPFHPRCSFAYELCKRNYPNLLNKSGRKVACHLYS